MPKPTRTLPHYFAGHGNNRQVCWDIREADGDGVRRPTLDELKKAAKKYFPGVPSRQIQVTTSGYYGEIVILALLTHE